MVWNSSNSLICPDIQFTDACGDALLQWPDKHQIDELIRNGGSSVPPSVHSSHTRRAKPKSARGVTWTVETALELLEAMKVYVQKNKLKLIGSDLEKWKAIAAHLPNPLGLELQKYAESCKVVPFLTRLLQLAITLTLWQTAHVCSEYCFSREMLPWCAERRESAALIRLFGLLRVK